MKIKKCSDFLNEKSPGSLWGSPDEWSDNNRPNVKIPPLRVKGDGPDYLYHAIEPEALASVMRDGLKGKIYLTTTPEEARGWHPIVLRIDVRGRQLTPEHEGFTVQDVSVDKIRPI